MLCSYWWMSLSIGMGTWCLPLLSFKWSYHSFFGEIELCAINCHDWRNRRITSTVLIRSEKSFLLAKAYKKNRHRRVRTKEIMTIPSSATQTSQKKSWQDKRWRRWTWCCNIHLFNLILTPLLIREYLLNTLAAQAEEQTVEDKKRRHEEKEKAAKKRTLFSKPENKMAGSTSNAVKKTRQGRWCFKWFPWGLISDCFSVNMPRNLKRTNFIDSFPPFIMEQ